MKSWRTTQKSMLDNVFGGFRYRLNVNEDSRLVLNWFSLRIRKVDFNALRIEADN